MPEGGSPGPHAHQFARAVGIQLHQPHGAERKAPGNFFHRPRLCSGLPAGIPGPKQHILLRGETYQVRESVPVQVFGFQVFCFF